MPEPERVPEPTQITAAAVTPDDRIIIDTIYAPYPAPSAEFTLSDFDRAVEEAMEEVDFDPIMAGLLRLPADSVDMIDRILDV